MMLSNKTLALAAALTAGALLAGPALALDADDVREAIVSAEHSGSVNGHLKDGVVVLDGNVDTALERAQIESAVGQLDGVTDVQNNILY